MVGFSIHAEGEVGSIYEQMEMVCQRKEVRDQGPLGWALGWLEHQRRCCSPGWEELGGVGCREGQDLGFGRVTFELPLGHPGGGVGSAEIRVGVWKSGRSPGKGCKPRWRGWRRRPRREWDRESVSLTLLSETCRWPAPHPSHSRLSG